MPLQNRVAPDGSLHAVAIRGIFTGNRGLIHDPATRKLLHRRWSTPAWITCRTSFRGRHREVMGSGWTELFFLDEITALAAGHRPCFECRREDALRFAGYFPNAYGKERTPAAVMDRQLHIERVASRRMAMDKAVSVGDLPPGAVVTSNGRFLARHPDGWLAWDFAGYRRASQLIEPARLVTPRSTIEVLCAGYIPVWHPSAAACLTG